MFVWNAGPHRYSTAWQLWDCGASRRDHLEERPQVKIRPMVQRQGLVAALAVVVLGCVEAFLLPPVFATQATPLDTKARVGGSGLRAGRELSMKGDKVAILVSGLPGAMGKEVAAACLRRGLTLCPWALTGPMIEDKEVTIDDGEGGEEQVIKLVKGPVKGDGEEECDARLQGVLAGYRATGTRLIAVDYTHPSAVNLNARLFHRHKIDFVMGTTGGDREALLSETKASGVRAVIAPNMAKQIVALQATLELMAEQFPGAFSGYNLQVTESHQSTKADTSGTAKALTASFSKLTGTPYDNEDIKMIRDKDGQLGFGVPESALKGHAFHTYQLLSNDKSVEFQFRHNVCGRSIYAEGTADALVFLAQQGAKGAAPRVYDMVDVLKAGAM